MKYKKNGSHYWAGKVIPCLLKFSRGRVTEQETYQLTHRYNILHGLQVRHHLTLTFIIHHKYISTLLFI